MLEVILGIRNTGHMSFIVDTYPTFEDGMIFIWTPDGQLITYPYRMLDGVHVKPVAKED